MATAAGSGYPDFPFSNTSNDRNTRYQETALGNLFTDAMLWYANEKYPAENAQIVLIPGGFIDNVIRKGTITVGTVFAATAVAGTGDAPDSRTAKLAFVTLTGAEIKQLINYLAGVTPRRGRGNANTWGWPIGSKNISWTLQYPLPPVNATFGSSGTDEARKVYTYYYGRLKPNSVKIGAAAISDSQSYRVVTTDNVLSGNNGWFLSPRGANHVRTNIEAWKTVVEYINDQGKVTPSTTQHILVEGGVATDTSTGWVKGSWECPLDTSVANCLLMAPAQ